jgi:glycosyltransferase involved in cell wall biosynthesis
MLCSATVTERKRVCELARAAVEARTPIEFIGKPYSANDPYAMRFASLVEQNPRLLRWAGAIQDREQLAARYRICRGFVLLSDMETRSLATEEAAASACPLLLSDLPWARSVFGQSASYCPVTNNVQRTGKCLRWFYDAAPQLPVPPKPKTWLEVAEQLRSVYQQVASTSS